MNNKNTNGKKDVKIGARILSNEQLNKLLPNDGNSNIMKQVEQFRQTACEVNKKGKSDKENNKFLKEFGKYHNNIFSILGRRGSGKTSVLLTIKYNILNKLNKDAEVDIIMPVIVPEKMETTSDVLGWFLGYIEDKVKEIEGELYDTTKNRFIDSREFEGYFEHCRKKDDNPLRRKYEDVLKEYQYTKREYKDILVAQYVGFNEYIKKTSQTLASDQKLVDKFEDFLEELISVKRKSNIHRTEPLLFVFFDDVDVSTERCIEVLNMILRYLSHPNVVVFIAGNYTTFSEVLTIDFLRKDGILTNKRICDSSFIPDNSKNTALEIRKALSQDYLKKVLPPALRYHMPKITNLEKVGFKYSTEENLENGQDYDSLYVLLGKNFIDEDFDESTDCFLKYNTQVVYPYFKIFDDNPRGLMNVYYLLYSMHSILHNEDHKDTEQRQNNCVVSKEKQFKDDLVKFINTVVDSSLVLSRYEKEISKIINVKDDLYNSYIDYEYLYSLFVGYKENKNDLIHLIEDFITIFILAYFVENILRIKSVNDRNIHSADVLCKILGNINDNFIIYPKVDDTSMLLNMYGVFSENIPYQNITSLTGSEGKNRFLSIYFRQIENMISTQGEAGYRHFFDKIFKQDEKWVEEKINLIMKYGAEDEAILKDKMEESFKRVNLDVEMLSELRRQVSLKYTNGLNIREELKKDLRRIRDTQTGDVEKSALVQLLNKAKELYSLVAEQKWINEEIEKQTYVDYGNLEGIEEYSKPRWLDLRRKVMNDIDKLYKYVGNERRKKIWDNALERGDIEYISHREPESFIDEKSIINTFRPYSALANGYVEYFPEITSNFKDHLNGYLIKKKSISKTLMNYANTYFYILEKIRLFESFLIPEIDIILDAINQRNDSIKATQKIEALNKKKTQVENAIGEMRDNLREFDGYGELEHEYCGNTIEDYKNIIMCLNLKLLYKELSLIIPEESTFENDAKLDDSLRRMLSFYNDKLKESSYLLSGREKDDEVEMLEKELAMQIVNVIFVNYIGVEVLIEINKRKSDEFFEQFLTIKKQLFEGIENEGFSSFNQYLNLKKQENEKVNLNV